MESQKGTFASISKRPISKLKTNFATKLHFFCHNFAPRNKQKEKLWHITTTTNAARMSTTTVTNITTNTTTSVTALTNTTTSVAALTNTTTRTSMEV